MKWKDKFTSAILSRGREYHRACKVKRISVTNSNFSAVVRGTRNYHVSIMTDGEEITAMSCDCAYAASGRNCKHMAALCYALEAAGNFKVSPEKKLPDTAPCMPFKRDRDDSEYQYFDMSKMVKDMNFTMDICERAKKLAAEKTVELKQVHFYYDMNRYEKGTRELIGRAEGVLHRGRAEYGISLTFNKEQIIKGSCYTPGCKGMYDANYRNSYSYYSEKLCVHEVSMLFLLDGYFKEINPGDATDLAGTNLMNGYQHHHSGRVVSETEEDKQILHLEPRLENNYGDLNALFRIGADKLYVVKNLTELVEKIESKEELLLGSKTLIMFSKCEFDEKSGQLYRFIKNAVDEEVCRKNRLIRNRNYYADIDMEIKSSIPLDGARLDAFFELVKDETIEYIDKSDYEKKKKTIGFRDKEPRIKLTINKHQDRDRVFQGISVKGELQKLMEGGNYYYYVEEPFLNRSDREGLKEIMPLYDMEENGQVSFQVGRKRLSEFYYTILPMLERHGEVLDENRREIEEYLPPEVSFRFFLDAEDKNIFCQAKAVYGENERSVLDMLEQDGTRKQEAFRDMHREAEVFYYLNRLFPEIDVQQDCFHCGDNEDAVYQVLDHGVDRLLAIGEVNSTDRFRRMNIRKAPKVSIGVSLEANLLDLSISSEDISREELLEVLNSYRRKKKYHRLKNGDFLNIEGESFEALEQMMEACHLSPKEFVKGKMQLPAYRALYLDKMLEQNEELYSKRDSRFKKLVKEVKAVKDSDYEVPDSLQNIMRSYQITGYRWLRVLAACGFGGILADDMGLGKTLQMISVLLAYKEEGQTGTSLIVAPASLIYNWQEELQRFAPALSVCVLAGTQKERREKLEAYRDFDVLVTSYDLLKRDIVEYESCQFACQVLDEAQVIKNHSTAAAKAVKVIRSRTRFALTGTPIENRLSELWSIFDYLMPGFLYGYDVFKKEMETPVVKNKDEKATERLKKMVTPFILRRLKKDVLKDLPDKLEEVRFAKLEEKQQKVYDAQVMRMKSILGQQDESEFRRNKLQVLAELTRIRQVCCDPALIWDNYDGGSAKREACLELIQSAIEGEHKILVFSQFTSMLELLEKDLDRAKISYYKITGDTGKEKRIELVRSFNEDDTPVFLISLKAGGTGLNLTGADVVIHYDPWWNLAVQNQATDRAHRIGQKRIVSVYKLIVKDSIEEKILHMQEEKKNLADEILTGEASGLTNLNKEELMELIQ